MERRIGMYTKGNVIDLNNILKITDEDVKVVFDYCKRLVKKLDKDIEDLTFETVKVFMEDIGNKRIYLLSGYDGDYSYIDYAIDTLDSNIRFL